MSLYSSYISEKTGDHVYETDKGFAVYAYQDDFKTVYIKDIYVTPEFRKTREAATIADNIVRVAKELGCTKVLGSVVPGLRDSTSSLKVLLAYGFELDSSANNFILFKKDI